MKSLESFLPPEEDDFKRSPQYGKSVEIEETHDLDTEVTTKLPASYLISVTYDGRRSAVALKLYEPKSRKIYSWYDRTKHLPYCLTDLPVTELKSVESHQGFDHFETVGKYNALTDREVELTKILAKDPLAIGGRPSGSIRDMIPKAWEANIRYYESYIYDREISTGMPYTVSRGHLIPVDYQPPEEDRKNLEDIFKDEDPEFKAYVDRWFSLLECPVPEFRRLALDIEVYSPIATRIPDPREAEQKIIAIALADSDGNKRVLVLKRPDVHEGEKSLPEEAGVEFFESEKSMMSEVFRVISEYPIVLTFNGDDFDLSYLYHRAERLKFTREQIPIELSKTSALLSYGTHIDLYKFFFNRSIQIYAFGQRYTEVTLNGVAESLIGIGKVELEHPVSELPYTELVNYALRDAEITLQLTKFEDDLVMKLIIVLARISRLPIEDVTRQGVSGWIRSLMFAEHRRMNWLIPRPEELLELKGVTSTTSIIEGKKYRGAIVVEPKPGVHFDVSVLDFASLYPSIIKRWNLSYETVLCPHPECKDNKIPETTHWVCKKHIGISSKLIGSLKDLRVKWYKPRSKDKKLTAAKRSWYNVIQQSLKVILNASYGVFGSEAFSLYCPPVAESTAAVGRYAITEAIKEATSLGINVVYGDTDSIFIKSPTQEQINKLLEWSNSTLGMELDVDKVYRYVAFSLRKKNYLGVYPDGRVDIKGLTGKKRHVPEFIKETFLQVIQILSEVMSPDEFERARNKIRGIAHQCYEKLSKRDFSLAELAFSIMISKPIERYEKTTPQHVKAAKLLVDAGYEVKPGDVITLIKVKNSLGVKPVQLASIEEVDTKKYMTYMRSTLEQVLDAIGLDFDEILGSTRLESFLWNSNQN